MLSVRRHFDQNEAFPHSLKRVLQLSRALSESECKSHLVIPFLRHLLNYHEPRRLLHSIQK